MTRLPEHDQVSGLQFENHEGANVIRVDGVNYYREKDMNNNGLKVINVNGEKRIVMGAFTTLSVEDFVAFVQKEWNTRHTPMPDADVQNQWQLIETCPPDEEVWLWFPNQKEVQVGVYGEADWWYSGHAPTLWMPYHIPTPPDETLKNSEKLNMSDDECKTNEHSLTDAQRALEDRFENAIQTIYRFQGNNNPTTSLRGMVEARECFRTALTN